MNNLPVIRQSERVDFKRCMKKWFWRWRMGLVPKARTFGALQLGTWMHTALELRYTTPMFADSLREAFDQASGDAISEAQAATVPGHEITKAFELRKLGLAVAGAYDKRYGADKEINPIGAEIPLEFEITNEDDETVAIHRLKPDLLYRDKQNDVWLLENKTAKQIRLEHLPIDDQARGYAAMSELALRNAGYLKPGEHVKGVTYNFLRKVMPDERETNEKGQSLNKNGSVSARQPTPVFVRHPIVLSNKAKLQALLHIQREAIMITRMTTALRSKELKPESLIKTPHSSCSKLCDFFTMCVVEEQGGDYKAMQRNMFNRENPYTYEQDTADIPVSFELS
jgi:hypothetical protein